MNESPAIYNRKEDSDATSSLAFKRKASISLTSNLIPAREGTSVGIKRTRGSLAIENHLSLIAFESCTMRILYMYIKGRVSMPSSFSIASESH